MGMTGIEAGAATCAAVVIGALVHGAVIWYLARVDTWSGKWE